jgi:hypothetical protein
MLATSNIKLLEYPTFYIEDIVIRECMRTSWGSVHCKDLGTLKLTLNNPVNPTNTYLANFDTRCRINF